MFKVNLSEYGDVRVYFQHSQEDYLFSPQPKGTRCVMTTDEKDGEKIGQYTAVLYYKDTFIKEKGRKYSLTNLLKDMNMPREERKKVWAAYWKAKGA